MEAKGLFSGAQNITVTEVNFNNVAGAYHDYRAFEGPKSPKRGARDRRPPDGGM